MVEIYFALCVFIAFLLVMILYVLDMALTRSINEIREALKTIKEGLKKKKFTFQVLIGNLSRQLLPNLEY